MTIIFDGITQAKTPGSQVEFSAIRAVSGLPAAPQKLLLVGQRRAAGTVAQLLPRRIVSADQAAGYFGRGSILHAMCVASLLANPTTETWAIAIDDNAGGTAATQTITYTGPASGNGVVSLLIGGQKVPVIVTSGDSVTAIATATAAAINASLDLEVTATSAVGVVTVTFRHKGTAGNDLDIRLNHYEGDVLPAGVGAAIAAGVVGATDPDLATVFAAIGDEHYPWIALGLNNAANLTAADTELTSRWGPQRQIEGRAFAAISGTLNTCVTFGQTRNGIHTTVLGGKKVPTPTWKQAAAIAAIAGRELNIDPARPLTGLTVAGLVAPVIADRFSRAEREQLLSAGISTFTVDSTGAVAIERLISCYQTNAFAAPDPTWRDVTTTATLAYLRFSWRLRMAARFPRAKLTDDTIAAVRAETIALARDWEEAGLIESADAFIAGMVIERDATSRTQLNLLLTPDLVNGLLQFAARIEFIL